jgi:hypothetical protein
MGHVVSNEGWATIDVDTANGRVFIQEDWYYHWRLWTGVTTPWTLAEKRALHSQIDRQIWGTWSNRIRLGVTGHSAFAQRFRAGVGVNFDMRWDIKLPAHWQVTVWKVPAGSTPTNPHRSFVNHATRRIELNTADIAPRGAGNAGGSTTTGFRTAPHEYGHTIGPTGSHLRDEYGAGHPHLRDNSSIMNIGRDLRRRHLTEVINALNRMMPGTTFNTNTLPL